MPANPVRWFEIYVQDMPRARAFYEAVLGLKLDPLASPDPSLEMFTFPMSMNEPGAGGALAKMPGCPSGGNSTLVYFASEDCAAEAGRAAAAGGKVFKDKFSIGMYGFITLLVDTEGNMFGVHSSK